MRFIDADELIKDIMELWDYKTVDGITATTVLKQTITDIENQPTVKAIPIKWLVEQANKYVEEDENGDNIWKEHIVWLLNEWEKENADL